MCSEEKLNRAKNGKAFILDKKLTVVLAILSCMVIFGSAIFGLSEIKSDVKLGNEYDIIQDSRILDNAIELSSMKETRDKVIKVDYNLRSLCKSLGIDYID